MITESEDHTLLHHVTHKYTACGLMHKTWATHLNTFFFQLQYTAVFTNAFSIVIKNYYNNIKEKMTDNTIIQFMYFPLSGV